MHSETKSKPNCMLLIHKQPEETASGKQKVAENKSEYEN